MTPKGRAALRASGKKPAPETVAAEFLHADKGKVKNMPKKKHNVKRSPAGIKLARVKSAPDSDNSY